MEPHAERVRRRPRTLEREDCVPLELWIGREKVDVRIDGGGIRFAQGGREALLSWSDALALVLSRMPRDERQ